MPPAVFSIVSSLLAGLTLASAGEVPSPESYLGFPVGQDRKLANLTEVAGYFRALDAASDRVTVEVAGRSTLDNDMLLVILTSEANTRELDRYRGIARRLANPDDLSPRQAEDLLAEGKTIVLVTCTIHATEVGSMQMSMEFAHDLATTTDPAVLGWMDDVILLLMPSINPDGQVMVIDWYNKHLGTEYEGGDMPWLYHHYAGHDNNRDFYMLTQKESRVVNRILYHDWLPQVFVDEHQMGSTGPRMFVPPQADPLAPEVHSMIFRMADLLGTGMSMRLEEAGKAGVGHNMIFDSYWPGGTRNTAWWKNVTGLLTEVASARIATPVYIEPGELEGKQKGLPRYERRANYPSPWSGGWWRLRDIIDYEMIATRSLLESSSRYRREILETFYRLGREAIRAGESELPYAFVIPAEQHDPVAAARLVDLLLEHSVRVHQLDAPMAAGRATYPTGSYVILASQPYRAFLLTMLRPQRYPEVAMAEKDGPIFEPYDHTSWSLPIAFGVEVEEVGDLQAIRYARLRSIESPEWPGGPIPEGPGGYLVSHAADSVFPLMNRLLSDKRDLYWLGEPGRGATGDLYIPAGEVPLEELVSLAREVHAPVTPLDAAPTGEVWKVSPVRVGLYKPWIASIDEGWTRWLLERYGFDIVSLTNEEIKEGTFRKKIDVLVLPDVEGTIIKEGKPSGDAARSFAPLPAEYAGGIDRQGGDHIKRFVQEGGSIVAIDSSTEYAIELLELPVRNVLEKTTREEFHCPGSMLSLHVDTGHPIGYGTRPAEAGFFARSRAFETRLPDPRFDRRVVAGYPADEKDILVSGYIKGARLLERRAAVIDLKVGDGRVVLFGMRPQYRAQPLRTFKLFFNSLYLNSLQKTSL